MLIAFVSLPFLIGLLLTVVADKRVAFFSSLAPLVFLIFGDISSPFNYLWFPPLAVHFHLSVDSLSLLFLYLTAFIIPFAVSASTRYFNLILFLEGLLFVFFTTRDLVVFTIFWEAMLLPLYFIISASGKPEAAFKFLLYMIGGSVLMIAAVLTLYLSAGTFDLDALKIASFSKWIFFAFILAFAVKTPLFPFHGWLPDVYTAAPVGGTILLSALLSKAGIYGIIRVGMGLFPEAFAEFSPMLLSLAIAGVFYGGLSAWMQTDFKRLIAYSSLSHVNFILAGLFVASHTAHTGAVLQSLNHGITITALFLSAGWLEQRVKTTSMSGLGGLATYMPTLAWVTLFFVLSSVALPGTNNFVGELLILFGTFGVNPWIAFILGCSIILSAIYMLRFMQKVYFEKPVPFQNTWQDIRRQELLIALPLILVILWIGIYPSPLLNRILEF